jgi:magnesium chelatase family protein
VDADPTPFNGWSDLNEPAERSEIIRRRVIKARAKQLKRFRLEKNIHCNAQISDKMLNAYCKTDPHALRFLLKSMDQYQLSFRAYNRILKVSRTIADLADSTIIDINHIAEAIHFRSLDKPLMVPGSRKKNHLAIILVMQIFRYKGVSHNLCPAFISYCPFHLMLV